MYDTLVFLRGELMIFMRPRLLVREGPFSEGLGLGERSGVKSSLPTSSPLPLVSSNAGIPTDT